MVVCHFTLCKRSTEEEAEPTESEDEVTNLSVLVPRLPTYHCWGVSGNLHITLDIYCITKQEGMNLSPSYAKIPGGMKLAKAYYSLKCGICIVGMGISKSF